MNAHQRRRIRRALRWPRHKGPAPTWPEARIALAGQAGDSLMLRGGKCGCVSCASRGWSSRYGRWLNAHYERLNPFVGPLPDILGGDS